MQNNPHYIDRSQDTYIPQSDQKPQSQSTKAERKIHGVMNGIRKLIGRKLPAISVDEAYNSKVSMSYDGKHLTTFIDDPRTLNMRKVVYQTILRLLYNEPQVEGCPLMSPYNLAITDRQADKLFVKLLRKHPWVD